VAHGSPLPCADYPALPELKEEDEELTHHPLVLNRGTAPAFLLPPPKPSLARSFSSPLLCTRPLVCLNLCNAFNVLGRGRTLESNERSAYSYAQALAVSVTFAQLHPPFSQLLHTAGHQRCSHMHLILGAHPLTGSLESPRKTTDKDLGKVQKLPSIGTNISEMVGCARLDMHRFLYSR
jgi:hypothetical protein